jgi:hypothetical protein
MKKVLALLALLAAHHGASAQPITAPSDQRADPQVLAHQQTLAPGLKKLGTRVFGAEFIGYSNFGFIEGDTGIIVVDAGWFPAPTANAMTLLREQDGQTHRCRDLHPLAHGSLRGNPVDFERAGRRYSCLRSE